MNRGTAGRVLCAIMLAGGSACATLGSRSAHTDAVAGEWVDLHKTTAGDTMVWVLTPGGDDQLLHVAVRPSGTDSTLRHFGRWSLASSDRGGENTMICFVRRPGRDASSCVDFTIDTVRSGDHSNRRLRLRGYTGEHHTTDRELIERLPRPVPVHPADSATAKSAEGSGGSDGAGGFQPRAVQPERPSVATHAGTVAPGYAELETGFEHDRNADGSRAGLIPTVLKVGLTKRTQLSVQLPTLGSTDTPTGLGDIAVGLKWRVMEDDPFFQDIAVLPQVKFSTGGDRGTGTTDASLLLINSRTLGPIGLDLNVGVTRRSGDGSNTPRTATMWAVAAGIPVRGALGWALEAYGLPGTGGAAGTPPVVAILTGPTLVLRQEVELDLGIITPVTGPQPRAIYAGLVTNLGRIFSLPK